MATDDAPDTTLPLPLTLTAGKERDKVVRVVSETEILIFNVDLFRPVARVLKKGDDGTWAWSEVISLK